MQSLGVKRSIATRKNKKLKLMVEAVHLYQSDKNLSQKEVAEKMGISKATMERYVKEYKEMEQAEKEQLRFHFD